MWKKTSWTTTKEHNVNESIHLKKKKKKKKHANVCEALGYSTTCSSKRVGRLHRFFISALLPFRPSLSAAAFFSFSWLHWLATTGFLSGYGYHRGHLAEGTTRHHVVSHSPKLHYTVYLGFLVCWANRRTNKSRRDKQENPVTLGKDKENTARHYVCWRWSQTTHIVIFFYLRKKKDSTTEFVIFQQNLLVEQFK